MQLCKAIGMAPLLLLSTEPSYSHGNPHFVVEQPAWTVSITLQGMDFVNSRVYDDGIFEGLSDFVVALVSVQGGLHDGEPDYHATAFQLNMDADTSFDNMEVKGVCGPSLAGLFQRKTCSFELKNPIEIYRHQQCDPVDEVTIALVVDEFSNVSVSDVITAISIASVVFGFTNPIPPIPGQLVDKYLGNILESTFRVYKFVFRFDPKTFAFQANNIIGVESNPKLIVNDDPVERLEVGNTDGHGLVSMGNLVVKLGVTLARAPEGTPAHDSCPEPATSPPAPPPGDVDLDTVPNDRDNCSQSFNPLQRDSDTDGFGDVCDVDADGDGFATDLETQPFLLSDALLTFSVPENGLVNPGSCLDGVDNDEDGLVDFLDSSCDTDSDSVIDPFDNCIFYPNPDQLDSDRDRVGDACEDADGDFHGDGFDNCSGVPNADQADTDGDGRGNACDEDDDNDGFVDGFDNCPSLSNAGQTDADDDGIGDLCDNCLDVSNADQSDSDHNGLGDACELIFDDGFESGDVSTWSRSE